jgi:hypothetical protein
MAREHYIPYRKSDLVRLLAAQGLAEEDRASFERFADILGATFHFHFHDRLERLKDVYAPFDPDGLTSHLENMTPDERDAKVQEVFVRLQHLVRRANFNRLSWEEIDRALEKHSDWGVNLDIDFDLIDRMALFVRGDTVGERSRRVWWKFFRKETKTIAIYKRLVLAIKLKPSAELPAEMDTEDILLKYFKDIPKDDIDMLLPGGKVVLPWLKRWQLRGSICGTALYVLWKVFDSIFKAAITFTAAYIIGLASLAGMGLRQYQGYQSARIAYSLRLAQSLYYQNLANNSGVLFTVLDEAEEQDVRETLLGYYYLWRFPRDEGWTASELDAHIESELHRLAGIQVDFEIDDALRKLERLELVSRDGDRYMALPIHLALAKLDSWWDNYYAYASESPVPASMLAKAI